MERFLMIVSFIELAITLTGMIFMIVGMVNSAAVVKYIGMAIVMLNLLVFMVLEKCAYQYYYEKEKHRK